jgi:hypothetical protein
MAGPVQFSLSLELANIIPIVSAVSSSARELMTLARQLKRGGSDIIVEEDLAAIFGRGKIVRSLENHFRDVVKISGFRPLHSTSEIILDAGPGPTVQRALKYDVYLATVIQLSFLSWTHEPESLANGLTESMIERHNQQVEGVNPDPDYSGILSMIHACASQTAAYPWELLVQLVESRFPEARQWFWLRRSPLKRLSRSVLTAAVDYLFLIQYLPENRVMMLSSQEGLVPIIVWAHYILGLNVLVQSSPDGDIKFGSGQHTQVIIQWDKLWETRADGWFGVPGRTSHPTVFLLDADMSVVLKKLPENDEMLTIEGSEFLRLGGYGTVYLRRIINKLSIVSNNHAVYSELAELVIAMSIASSEALVAKKLGPPKFQSPTERAGYIEKWQIVETSTILFHDITIDHSNINQLIEKAKKGFKKIQPPIHVREILESARISRDWGLLMEQLEIMKAMLLVFSHVVDIRQCPDLPVQWLTNSFDLEWVFTETEETEVQWSSAFMQIWRLIAPMSKLKSFASVLDRLFLVSEHGWSIFYNVGGDQDPGDVQSQHICIQRGVPTSTRTNVRKYAIIGTPRVGNKFSELQKIEESGTFQPRCLSTVTKRLEYYSSGISEFSHTIRCDVEEMVAEQSEDKTNRFSIYTSYSLMQQAHFGIWRTVPCQHTRQEDVEISLRPENCTVRGFSWCCEIGISAQVAISLVYGNPRSRWLAVFSILIDEAHENLGHPDSLERCVLLRCRSCCVNCAIDQANRRQGNWLVIL